MYDKTLRDAFPRLVCWASLLLCSCMGTKDMDPEAQAQNHPTDYRLSLARGGGFSGGERGCDLWPQGRARVWRKRGPTSPADSLQSSAVAPSAVDQLYRELVALPPVIAPGNLSYRVRLISPDTTQYWTWTEEGPLTDWYRRAQALCPRREETKEMDD
ncbi:MAG: hypothetical protein GKR89_00185 [Candidatus Latescibacteria bacterium]|nr:hypothetical protein [Candidatus Latescibacterota bacterium]